MIPEKRGAPEASAIPRHRGTATKKTIIDAGASCLKFLKIPVGVLVELIVIYFQNFDNVLKNTKV